MAEDVEDGDSQWWELFETYGYQEDFYYYGIEPEV